ncbi:perilipin-2-like isoform X1 [Branchiostoma floridae]|uniref:Perilipin-2-like isoform X1 n=1 Tax=Branchiostoma floridae TaxID=7739 RepID=A0A9J7KNH0_BRAFL|nr:perilipin-2-like isoform X1 [Branchiostoma floridae]
MANTDDTMENIVERMGSLPIVNTTVHQVSTLYSSTKERWWVARCTLGLAERSLQMAAWTAKPVAERMGMDFDGTVAMANQYACRGLDVLEEKVPLLTKQPGQIVEETKKAVDSKVQAGSKRLLQTSLGQVIWWTTDTALDITERCVEYYLPNRKKDDEKEVEQVPKAAETEKSLLVRATTLTDKVHSRLSEGASIRMKSVQRCGRELLDTLRDMLELIERAKGEVNMEVQGDLMLVSNPVCQEPDKDEDTQSLERQSLQVVASLLQEVGSICSLMVLQVWALPQHLQDNITQAKAMADQLYDSFCKRLSGGEALPGLGCLHCQIHRVINTLVSLTDFIWTLPPFPWLYSVYVLVRLGRAIMAVALYQKYALFFQEKYLLCQEKYLLYLPGTIRHQAEAFADLPGSLLGLARAQLDTVSDTLLTVTEYMLNLAPLQWLIPDVCLVDLENIDFGFDEILEDLELNDGGGGGGVYVPYFHPRRPIHGA